MSSIVDLQEEMQRKLNETKGQPTHFSQVKNSMYSVQSSDYILKAHLKPDTKDHVYNLTQSLPKQSAIQKINRN